MKSTLLKFSSLLLAFSVYANDLYLQQVGNNLSLTVTQKGTDNEIEGYAGTGQLLGNNNTIKLQQGYEGNNYIGVATDGNNNNITVAQEKFVDVNGNVSNDTNSYGYHTAEVDVDGDYNLVEIVQRNNNTSTAGQTSKVVIMGGDYNEITTLQTGDGAHESLVTARTNTSNNTVDVFQNSGSSVGHKSVMSIYTDNNTLDVDQTGSTQNKAYVLFSADAVGPTDFTISQTGGNTYGNPDTGSYATINCGSAAGCTVNVSQ